MTARSGQAGFATPVVALGLAVIALALGGLSIDLWRVVSAHSQLAGVTDAAAVAGAGGIDLEQLYLGEDAEPRLDVDLATKRTCDYLVEHLGLADCPGPQVTVIVEPDRVIVKTTGTVTLGIAKLLLIAGRGDATVEISAKATAAPFRLARSGVP